MNPPYGRQIGRWVKKAWESAQSGACELVVCLLPARTDTGW
jgi:site-specific DNA-methyltransferase (adenine-specific)